MPVCQGWFYNELKVLVLYLVMVFNASTVGIEMTEWDKCRNGEFMPYVFIGLCYGISSSSSLLESIEVMKTLIMLLFMLSISSFLLFVIQWKKKR